MGEHTFRSILYFAGGLGIGLFLGTRKTEEPFQFVDIPIPGFGSHTECVDGRCINIFFPGQDQCDIVAQDCPEPIQPPETHKECRNQRCINVAGAGADQCQVGAECFNIIPRVCDDGDVRNVACLDCNDQINGFVEQQCRNGQWEGECNARNECGVDFDCGFRFCPNGPVQRTCNNGCCSDPECFNFDFGF